MKHEEEIKLEKSIDDAIERIMNADDAYDAFQIDGDLHVEGRMNPEQTPYGVELEWIGTVDIRQSDHKQLYEDLLELENDILGYRIRNGVAFRGSYRR